jgi:hypothetical protein
MSALSAKELQKIRGIGAALSARLLASGCDTFRKVADLGEDGLKKFNGINFKLIPDIIRQAEVLAAEATPDKEERIKAAAAASDLLRKTAQELIRSANDRLGETLSEKQKKKLTEALVRFIEALESVELKIARKPKKAGKIIGKAETKLAALAEADCKSLKKGLKMARKSLQRVKK